VPVDWNNVSVATCERPIAMNRMLYAATKSSPPAKGTRARCDGSRSRDKFIPHHSQSRSRCMLEVFLNRLATKLYPALAEVFA